MAFSCLECLRRFSQALLIIANAFVALLGLCVLILGIWAQVNGRNYFDIVDNASEFTSVAVLLIIIGLFVMILGVIGIVGGLFASTVFGRITLGLYAIVLALLILCEVAGGVAAGVKRGDLQNSFTSSAWLTFNDTVTEGSKNDSWNTAQQLFRCCGVLNYTDYRTLFGNNSVPAACCNQTTIDGGIPCNSGNVTDNSGYTVYNQGCVTVVVGFVDQYLGALAAGGIIFGLLQIIGVVMACFVAIYKERENRYEVV